MTQIFSQAIWTIVFGLALLFVGGLTFWSYGTSIPNLAEEAQPQQQTQRMAFIYGTLASIAGIFLLTTSILLAI